MEFNEQGVDHMAYEQNGPCGPTGFVHRRILGAVGGFVSTGSIGGAIGGFVKGGGGGGGGMISTQSSGTGTPWNSMTPVQKANALGLVGSRRQAFLDLPASQQNLMESGFNTGTSVEVGQPCGPGQVRIGTTCVDPLAFLPGGAPLTQPIMQTPEMGIFGLMSTEARVVGTIQDRNGLSKPILRCPTGLVLAQDNRCYAKESLPKKARKWKPDPRPLLSASDARVLRESHAVEKKLVRIVKRTGDFKISKK